MEQGLVKGLVKGLEKGRQEERIFLLLRQLERRFGPLHDDLRRRVETAGGEQLLAWGDRLIDARTLDEVFQSSD